MSDKEKDGAAEALGCLAAVLALPPILLLRGWAMTILWGWFITPVFGLASPGLAACLGLSVTVDAFWGIRQREPADDCTFGEKCLRLILWPVATISLLLALGWVFHLFMSSIGGC